MARHQDLIGSWRMLSWTRQVVETGATVDAMGPDPIGYIAYHADGRMMASVFRRERLPASAGPRPDAEKAALLDSMLAYVAAWSLDGDTVTHHVECAWIPEWQIDLARPFTLDGSRLTISGAPGIDPDTGEEVVYRMEFRKV